jgi:hypothetical protein
MSVVLSEAASGSLRSEDSAMERTILHQKRARRLAEEDALRLYNRVRQLQKEEDKAKKRIVGTKKRANEIIKLRERNEQKQEDKEEAKREQLEEIERLKLENMRIKEETQQNKEVAENRIYADKAAIVQQTKEERYEIERMLEETRELGMKKAVEHKESIKKSQHEAEQRIQYMKACKLQMVSIVGSGWLVASVF